MATSVIMTSPQERTFLLDLEQGCQRKSCHQREFDLSFHSSTLQCEIALVSKSNSSQRELNFSLSQTLILANNILS